MAEITYNIKNGLEGEGGIIIVLIHTGAKINVCGSLKIEDAEQNLVWEHVFEAPYFQSGTQTMTIKIPNSALPSMSTTALRTLTITASHPWPDDEDGIITLNMPLFDSFNSISSLQAGARIQFTLNL